MNRKIKGLIGAAVLVMALPLQGLAAADAAASLQPVAGGAQVALDLHKEGAGEGVNALQMSFTLSPVSGSLDKADVTFDFSDALAGTVKRYSFDQSSSVLTVYVAGANGALFANDRADLGSIQVQTEQGEYMELSITTGILNGSEQQSTEAVSGLTLLRAGTTEENLTMQAETLTVSVGETSPAPEPTPQPEATQQPEVSEQPEATQQPSDSSTSDTNPGSNQGNGSAQSSVPAPTSAPATAVPGKTPSASSSAQSAVSETEIQENLPESEASSGEPQSQPDGSESQAQSAVAESDSSKVGILPLVIGIVLVAAAVVTGVVIWRRGRD